MPWPATSLMLKTISPLVQGHDLVIVAAHFGRRDIQESDVQAGKSDRVLPQERLLDVAGDLQFLLDLFLFQHLADEHGVLQGDGQEGGHFVQQPQVGLAEFPLFLVHRLQHAEQTLAHEHRHAEQGAGLEMGLLVGQGRVAADRGCSRR